MPIARERARTLAPAVFLAMLGWVVIIEATGGMSGGVLGIEVTMCGVAAIVAWITRRGRAPVGYGHALCAALWSAPVIGTLTAAYADPQPVYATLLQLEIVSAVVLLDTRSVIALLGAVLGLWVPLGLRDAGGPVVSILPAVTAATLALAMQIVMRRALVIQATTAAELKLQLAERTRLEEQLLHSQRMEAVGTLAAGLAHDMNNVLASITSFAGLLDDELDSPRARADLAQIVSESMRGAELTRGLLAFSRRGQYRKQTIRIDDVVHEVLPMLTRTLPRSIAIHDELNGDNLCVDGDPIQLGQALVNLGLNAAHAMTGTGTLAIATAVLELRDEAAAALALRPGRYARLRVSDTGAGMDEATRRRVFEPFFTTKPAGTGTGLGLSAVWGIVQSHQGAISVESTVGHGTTFCIYLPVVDAVPATRALPVMMPTEPLQRVGTVLVTDDEPAVRRSTARLLQRMGLVVLQAANGEEALAQLGTHAATIDLVILDMGMPVMGGAECFRKLREVSEVPVLIATGYAADAEVQELLARGAALIEKPYPSNAFIHEVGRLLEAGKAARYANTTVLEA